MDDRGEVTDLDSHLDGLYELARTACREYRYAVAVELLSPYLRHRPEHAHAWLNFGRCLERLGLIYEAERSLLRADEFEENRPHSQTALGGLYKYLGQFAEAEAQFAKAVLHPDATDSGWIWIMRGGNLAAWNHLDEALACHRRGLTMANADHDEAWLNIGYVLRAKGKYSEAIHAFSRALELTPEYDEAKDALAGLSGIQEAMELAKRTPPPSTLSG